MGLLFPEHDAKQKLRLKRTLMAFSGGVLHTLVCFLFYHQGLFRLSLEGVFLYSALIWTCGGFLFLYIRLGFNKGLRDPSLTLVQMFFALIGLLIAVYFLDQSIRPLVLMYSLVVYFFGVFQLNARGLLYYAAVASLFYGMLILLLLKTSGVDLTVSREVLVWAAYSVTGFAFAALGGDISKLRQKLRRRSSELQTIYRKMENVTITDDVTALLNRRYVMELLKQQVHLADRGGYQFSLSYLDVDDFKDVTDSFGYEVGDQVLRQFSEALMIESREADILARTGGEEFLVLFPNTELAEATSIAEKVRARIQAEQVSGYSSIKLSTSIGVVSFQQGDSLESMLGRADERLQQAKARGRNLVVAYDV